VEGTIMNGEIAITEPTFRSSATTRLTERGWQRTALVALCWLLAVAFAFGGVSKFLPGESFFGEPYADRFVDWGYPAWFRFVVGAGEIVGAVLLVIPRRRFLGAVVLTVILVGAVLTHLVNQDPLAESIAAPLNLVLVGAVLWVSRPLAPGGNRFLLG
jgi:uncharacterized membrane protein YphA (DoxX/SURF4 family)